MLKKKMAELIYENLLHKYGLKNFAEKKFTEVCRCELRFRCSAVCTSTRRFLGCMFLAAS